MADLQPVQHPVSALHVLAKISLPGFPDWVGTDADSGAVWISNRDKDCVDRIDPAKNRLVVSVPVGRRPCSGLAVGHGGLWVPNCGDRTVSRVDPHSNRVVATIPVDIADSEGAITAGEGAVWMPADVNGTLARIDPARDVVGERIALRSRSFAAAAGLGAVWATSTEHNLVSRVDPVTNRVAATILVGPSPRFLAVGLGAVWVLNQGDGSVSRIDPQAGRVDATIEVGIPGAGGDIAVGEQAVWVTALGKPLSRIDPQTNRVTSQFIGEGGDALRVGFGSIWLCSFGLQQLWRIDPAGL